MKKNPNIEKAFALARDRGEGLLAVLLQIQQVRELDAATKQELTEKVQAKQSEVEVNQATTAAAQKALDDLEKEFKESGAPDDWSKTA